MKTLIRFAALALALAAAAPAAAQSKQDDRPMFGLGIGLSDDSSVAPIVFVPINVKSNIRIEPYFGWRRSDMDDPPANNNPPSSFLGGPGPGKYSNIGIGVGGFLLHPVQQQVQLYAGGRIGLQFESFKNNAGGKISRTNLILGAVGGGEYMPVSRVALGAEVMIAYINYGDGKYSGGGASVEGGGGSATATMGTVFARFFLF